jgi:signal transduction histidine kinase
MPVDLTVEGEPVDLAPGLDASAYRIVQEALTNALKHAGPAHAHVIVRYTPETLELEVLDDGTGTGIVDGARPGYGLAGLRERVAIFGGELESGARAGGGYAMRARLPLGSGDR